MSNLHIKQLNATNAKRLPLKASARLGARLSPRRKLYLQELLDWLCWHGRKVLIDERAFATLKCDRNLDRFAVNQAIDDGFHLGVLDVRLAGYIQVVTLLSSNVEDAA